jgi:hypothetical protein
MQLITHETESWSNRKRFENGAATYSRDIVNAQADNLRKAFKGKTLVSTCPLISDLRPEEITIEQPELIVQYLHTFPYQDPLGFVKSIIERSAFPNADKWVFVSAYHSFVDMMNANGLKACFVPMMIDTSILPPAQNDIERAIWFGNIYKDKKPMFNHIRDAFKASGIKLSIITKGMLNSKQEVTQQEAWQLISRYQYGVGVGRCALEMYKMGLKVLVAGAHFGGLVMSDEDHLAQERTNYNGRIVTWNRDIGQCINMMKHSHIPNIRSITEVNHATIIKRQLS